MKPIFRLATLALAAWSSLSPLTHAANWSSGMKNGKPEFKSMGPLAFGPDGILFVADTRSAVITAIATADTLPAGGVTPLKVEGINLKIAALLGTSVDQIQIRDLAVNPISRNTYLAVSRGMGPEAVPVLLRVGTDGQVKPVALESVMFSRAELPNPPAESARGRQESITDIAFLDGRVMIAGLSNEEFASKFRAVPFPFTTVPNGTSVEIYHGSHGGFETRAPIRTFVPIKVGNEPQLLAAYTCTPLVQFPVKDLVAGAKVQGKTIAELGNFNNPLDMIVYQKEGKDYLLMANSSRGVMKFSTDGIDQFVGITARVSDKQGMPYETVAGWTKVVQLDLYDPAHALVLRGGEGNALNLESLPLP